MGYFTGNQVFKNTSLFYLSLNGDGVTFAANGNYSGAPVQFLFKPTVNVKIISIFASIVDVGGFTYNGYGSHPALTNGVKLQTTANGIIGREFTFKINTDYQDAANDFQILNYSAGASGVKASFNYPVEGQGLPVLRANTIDKVQITLNDNFTLINSQKFGLIVGVL